MAKIKSNRIRSKLITGVSASEITNRRIARYFGIGSGQKISYMVIKSILYGKTYYCCLSGGMIKNGEACLTKIGMSALEVLMSLPVGNNDSIFMREIKIGLTPLEQKVKETLIKLPSESKVCFFGDMSGELDGHIFNAFNVSGTTEV